jgi:hypothetical protein
MKKLIREGNPLLVLSLTLAVKKNDVNAYEARKVKEFMSDMHRHEIVQDACVVLERGKREEHLHFQIMMQGRFRPKRGDLQDAMRSIIDKRGIFERAYTCMVEVHKLDENRTFLSLSGCARILPLRASVHPSCVYL